jgi:predicted phage terminase large subunit-like protein
VGYGKNFSLSPDPADAAATLLHRREARKRLLPFVTLTKPDFEVGHHHEMIANALEQVALGDVRRLMIFCPPRHTKSELATRRFPAWYLGLNPKAQIISASYNSELASDFGREVRNLVSHPVYAQIFPETLGLSEDSQAANRWHVKSGGQYIAAGVGTAITGRGANLAIVDDPIKDRQEADSAVTRQRVWDWYRSVLYTRLMPGGSIICIMTRWHDDDLCGRLLVEMEGGGDKWEIISLPALAEDNDPLGRKRGEALWPEWYPEERLLQVKSVIGSRDWSALYQQNPQAEEGGFFLSDWFKTVADLPENLRIYGASDYATKDGEGDYTVHGVCGVDESDNMYVLDWWRGQTTSDIWVESFLDLVDKWKPLQWAEEAGQIRASLDPYITTRQRERRSYCVRTPFASRFDKRSRARAIQARMSSGKVYFLRGAPWLEDLRLELLRFDAGRNDDQVDVISLMGRLLENMQGAGQLKNWHPSRHIRRVATVKPLEA